MSEQLSDDWLINYVDQAKQDALHSFNFLRETGTLAATWTYHISHRIDPVLQTAPPSQGYRGRAHHKPKVFHHC